MKYKNLGNTGLWVSELTLGTMTFDVEGGSYAARMGYTGQEGADRLVSLSLDAGVNLFDTANIYASGVSEEILGKALGSKRKDAIVATKLFNTMTHGMNDVGTSRLAIMREVEASLKRLGTDYIDLYQVHNYDYTTPIEETMRALDDLVRQGKVRYIGLSNFTAWQIAKADGAAKCMGTERFCSVQTYYSLAGREIEREILPASIDLGLGTMIYSPLAGGFLTGKYTLEAEAEGRRSEFQFPPVDAEQGPKIIEALGEVAQDHEASIAQISLAWLLHKNGVTSVIVGARTEEQLLNNLGAVEIDLSREDIRKLDKASALKLEYPGYVPRWERGENLYKQKAQQK